MHAAQVSNSPRLQRVLRLLEHGGEYTTRQIIQRANVCAVNSIIAELRYNGFSIRCTPVRRGVFKYALEDA